MDIFVLWSIIKSWHILFFKRSIFEYKAWVSVIHFPVTISSHGILKRSAGKSSKFSNYIIFYRVLGIRDILVRIRIPGSVPLAIGSGSDSGSNSGSNYILHWFEGCTKKYNFLIICPQQHHLQTEIFNFLLKFSVEILFCRHFFSPLNNTFMRKGKDPDPVSDPQGFGSALI